MLPENTVTYIYIFHEKNYKDINALYSLGVTICVKICNATTSFS